jgi:8-oxo-dGTP pyrophosphatase MutT (NUDIX family)
VRNGPGGLETLMVRRHARSPVAPSAYVFPGGTVRGDDLEFRAAGLDPAGLAQTLSERSDTPVAAAQAVALYVSALRELFEEAGVLLVRDATGRLLTVDATDTSLQERMAATRLALQAHEFSLATVLAESAYQPAFDLLVPFSHWVTPAALAARFDTRFFVAEMPPGQTALHDTRDQRKRLADAEPGPRRRLSRHLRHGSTSPPAGPVQHGACAAGVCE